MSELMNSIVEMTESRIKLLNTIKQEYATIKAERPEYAGILEMVLESIADLESIAVDELKLLKGIAARRKKR